VNSKEDNRINIVLAHGAKNSKNNSLIFTLMNDCDPNERKDASRKLSIHFFSSLVQDEFVVKALIASFTKDEDGTVRFRDLIELKKMIEYKCVGSKELLEIIIDAISTALVKDDYLPLRRLAVETFSKIGDIYSEKMLSLALEDPDYSVRILAEYALAKTKASLLCLPELRDPKKILSRNDEEYLINILLDKNEFIEIRLEAIQALGILRSSKAVEPLISILSDEKPNLRRQAVFALYWLADVRAVGALLEALKNPDDSFRNDVIFAIVEIVTINKMFNPLVIESLISALKDCSESVGLRAASGLGRIGGSRAVEGLLVALKNRKFRSWAVIEALGKVGGLYAVDPLVRALKDRNYPKKTYPVIRLSIIRALGHIGGTKALQALIKALNNKSSDILKQAAEELGKIGGPNAEKALIKILNDDDSRVREAVIKALNRLDEIKFPKITTVTETEDDSSISNKNNTKTLKSKLRGQRLTGLGNYEKAVDFFYEALAHDPNDADTLGFIGEALFRLGRLVEANECFENCIYLKKQDQLFGKD
jgi:HEAT repeat protein